MKTWKEITHYGALDWAKEAHQVSVVDQAGNVVAEFRFAHTAEGWTKCRQRLREFSSLAMAIETSQGAAVEKLLESGYQVYPVNPHRAKSYRERKRPSGDKNDALDAWSMADALRVDGANWKPLATEDPLLQQLRLLCRDEVALITQRTALVNQLQQALYEYDPTALAAFDDWTQPAAWAFVVTFPTPQALVTAGRRKWQNFLHAHRLWRSETAPQRLEVFAKAEAFCGGEAVSAAKSLLAVTHAKLLRALQTQLEEYRHRIEKLFEQHPDHDLFGSLPGAAAKLAPRLLGEIGADRDRFTDANGLQCLGGTAPVRYASGQCHRVRLRRACNKHLRHAVHLWANLSRARCPWAQAYYEAHRAKGQSHSQAFRCLGNRWLKILWKMWQTHTCYDAELHTRNQTQHGSWILQLQPS